MTYVDSMAARCLLAFALLLPLQTPAETQEITILHEKVVALRGLPNASFEWQLLALDIARSLKSMPVSKQRTQVARNFKSQVESFVRRDAIAAAHQQLGASTNAWVQRVGDAFASQGLDMQTRAREENGTWIAMVDYRDMRENLAKKLSSETDLAASAQRAGFDRLEFSNTVSGKSWRFPLGGGDQLRSKILREAAAEWGIDHL
jgi:hypothetical protein